MSSTGNPIRWEGAVEADQKPAESTRFVPSLVQTGARIKQ